MSVLAKFTVTHINRSMAIVSERNTDGTVVLDEKGQAKKSPGEVQTISLSPSTGSDDPSNENARFFEGDPQGGINLGCVNIVAAGQFELGEEYYVEFHKVPSPVAVPVPSPVAATEVAE